MPLEHIKKGVSIIHYKPERSTLFGGEEYLKVLVLLRTASYFIYSLELLEILRDNLDSFGRLGIPRDNLGFLGTT